MFSSTGSVKLVSMDAGYKSSTILYLAFLIVFFIMVTIEQKIEENNYVENDDDIFVTSNLEENKNNIFDGKNNDVDSSNGGWNDNDDELFYLLKQNNCTIERVDGTKFGQDDFLRSYAYSKPLIITNIFDNAKKSYFKKSNLLANWSNFPVVLASANTYSYSKETTFGVYLQKYLKPLDINIPANETFYLFGDIDREMWKPLLDQYKLPSWNLPGHEPALSFGIAAVGTGVPFHFHGPGFAEVIFGAKYWFLSPFEKRPEWDPNVSTLQWMKEIFLNLPLEEKPLNCLLLPGELIYFPDKVFFKNKIFLKIFFS
uniref:Uncharacterized protein n=1 Tax=Meloidogyne enterolobii TaxID=390850 RepID=A0A6V7X0Y2_MELEN|nr:unnamed protein product [Meloidogyne enterolobii]